MYSRAEAKKLREDFWISFGRSFPRKWVLYNTKIKDFSFKFHFDTKKAMVSLDIEDSSPESRTQYYEKLLALKSILLEEYLPDAVFESPCILENQKEISRIYVLKENVSIHNKETWRETMEFLYKNMSLFENFWAEYEDVIKD